MALFRLLGRLRPGRFGLRRPGGFCLRRLGPSGRLRGGGRGAARGARRRRGLRRRLGRGGPRGQGPPRPLVADGDPQMARAVLDEERSPHRARRDPLHRGTAVGDRLDDAQVVEVPDLVVVLRVGDGRPQHLLDEPRRGARRVLQGRQGLAHRLAANRVEHEPGLARRHANEPGDRVGAHQAFPVGVVAAFSAAPCALNVRVSANSPSRWPTMFSVTYTGMNFRPLCTARVCPTNSGAIVDRRAHVFSTFFWWLRFMSSIRASSFSSMYGPFLSERPILGSYFFRRVTTYRSDGRAPRRVL